MSEDKPVFDQGDFGMPGSNLPSESPTEVDLTVKVSDSVVFEESSLGNAVSEVIMGLANDQIPKDSIRRIFAVMPPAEYDPDSDYGAQFDIRKEITVQLQICKGLRGEVFTGTGALRPGYELKDAKYVLSSVDKMIETLMKQHDKLVNFDRVQRIETAVKEAIEDLPDVARDAFLIALEKHLAD